METSRISRDSGIRTPSIHENPDVFSDDYVIDHDDIVVVDGFQPSGNQETEHQWASAPVRRSMSIGNPIESKAVPSASVSRNSTTKGYAPLDAQRLSRESARGIPLPSRAESLRSSISPFQQHRSNSSASSSTLMGNVRSPSPFQGASGPSHPYALYPQGVGVDRSSSVGTTSTHRGPQRSLSSANRPAHPYGMYPQNVFADPEDSDASPVDESIPVGFPGHSNNDRFHRRLGPEGEEQDIIGPDGHTEQLPPYSRFPDDIADKGLSMADSRSGVEVHQLSSNEDLIPNTDGRNANPTLVDASNQRTSRTLEQMESGVAEKTWSEKSWKEKRQTRFCGGKFPCWVLILAAGLVVLLAAIIGGIVGRVLAHEHAKAAYLASLRKTHSLVDATPISTPPDLPPVPTGTYGVPLWVPQESQSSCLDPTQVNTWSCNIPPAFHMAPVNIIVDPSGSGGQPSAQVVTSEVGQPIMQYGAQPPVFGPASLSLVLDVQAQNLGPAYYFQSIYNKTVIVDPSFFDPAPTNSKRDEDGFHGSSNWNHRNEISAGDQPWFCYFNNTSVELFIYDLHNVSTSAIASLNSMVTASSSTFSTPTISGFFSSSPSPIISSTGSTSGSVTATVASSIPTSTTSTSTDPSTEASPAYTSSTPSPFNSFSGFSGFSGSASPPPFPYSSPGGFQRRRRDDDDSSSSNGLNSIYPRSVKVEERRLPGAAVPPYCIRMQLLYNGTFAYAPNPDGSWSPWQVNLTESDPSSYPMQPGDHHKRDQTSQDSSQDSKSRDARTGLQSIGKRDNPDNSCHCEWVSQ